jgi:hypothetical protein
MSNFYLVNDETKDLAVASTWDTLKQYWGWGYRVISKIAWVKLHIQKQESSREGNLDLDSSLLDS